MALDRKGEIVFDTDNMSSSPNPDDDPDTEFHENLPTDIFKSKDINLTKKFPDQKYKLESNLQRRVDLIKTDLKKQSKNRQDTNEESTVISTKRYQTIIQDKSSSPVPTDLLNPTNIPVITISHTESDDEILQETQDSIKDKKCTDMTGDDRKGNSESLPETPTTDRSLDCKSLKRQRSVDSGKSNTSIS